MNSQKSIEQDEPISSNNGALHGKLLCLKLSEQDIEFIIEQGKKFVGKPQFLAKKRNILLNTAKSALEIITSTTVKPAIGISKAQIETIDSFLKEYPESENLEDIVLMCEIEEEIVAEYLERKPLNDNQKKIIREKYNTGCSVDDIANIANIPKAKVSQYVLDIFLSYYPNETEKKYHLDLQTNQINKLVTNFGKDQLTFQFYKMIISESFETLIENAEKQEQKPQVVFKNLLPLAFYYIKCSLPLENITTVIANASKITLTTHEIFHIIFQMSDPVLRGFTIEHYSFSNPVPLYYPNMITSSSKISKFNYCKELWYSLQPLNGLVSFGIGRAGWNPIGKSYLLDFIFDTDFVIGNSQNSAFHRNSIDIQMTKNLFGEVKSESNEESTKWAYIDCHGYSDLNIIKVLCQQLDIALIHISYHDYLNNLSHMDKDIQEVVENVKHVYLFIRDFPEVEVRKEKLNNICKLFIPNLTKENINIHAVKKKLKEVGHEILHLNITSSKYVGSEFLEKVLEQLSPNCLDGIQKDKKLIVNMTEHIGRVVQESKIIDFTFLNYYPHFVEYMSAYYTASYETDQEVIDKLNVRCGELDEKLKTTDMGNVVVHFNQIIERKNSTLILWKLSQELTSFSKKVFTKIDGNIQQKNDKYTLEILWREALLSNKYAKSSGKDHDEYIQAFGNNFSNYVERGEAFELIDGDNLRFFNKEIDALLSNLYAKQFEELSKLNKGKSILMKQAPIVLSIFGPQSSGKSTLLNYCFGCKFLTSAGRCTRGIYGSLSRLSRPVNNSNNFLILDTEGLDAIERGNIKDTSVIHFDRTMVLFCLSVSQVVIINVKGDIGSEMQKLLQICAYSLGKLKVRKVAAPKIFFVLNQQADPDPKKHLDSINILMDKLNKESELIDTDGLKVSDLIQVTKENLFILPSAFNSELVNKPGAKLFDSKVIKLSPAITFADKCADLRLAIINELENLSTEERQPFNDMSEWMDMSGVIWDTIIKYQDIVKYNNVEEIVCSNILNGIVSDLMELHIYCNRPQFKNEKEKLFIEIEEIVTLCHPETILTQKMTKFDKEFDTHQTNCITEFNKQCQENPQLKKMDLLCKESKTNLSRLIYIERKFYEDEIKIQIKAVLTEIKLSESMKKFQDAIISNVDHYLSLTVEQQESEFNAIWLECFRCVDKKEEENERYEIFNDLYSTFKMDSNTMDIQSNVYDWFRAMNFEMEQIISYLENDILVRFTSNPKSSDLTHQYIYTSRTNNFPIKEMTPYAGQDGYNYLHKESLFLPSKNEDLLSKTMGLFVRQEEINIKKWIPKECRPIVKYCSGYYNHPDVCFKDLDFNNQILLLASSLKCHSDINLSIWKKLISEISQEIQKFVKLDENISSGTVKQIVNFLCSLFKIVNYEINFIQARLADKAERNISTFVFAHAFKSVWGAKLKKRSERNEKEKKKKADLHEYFFEKIETRKLIRGTLNRETTIELDKNMSKKFSSDFIEALQRGVLTTEQSNIRNYLEDKKEIFSHKRLLISANESLSKEITGCTKEAISSENFVVQYVCNRNEILKGLFHDQWQLQESELYETTVYNLNQAFKQQVNSVIAVLTRLSKDLLKECEERANSDKQAFDSDSNFEISDIHSSKTKENAKESPFKAMTKYLEMYLDPKITPAQFSKFFEGTFEIDGIPMKKSDTYILCNKHEKPTLTEDTYKRLNYTKMFNTENIFNIHEYVTKFIHVLSDYKYEFSKSQFIEYINTAKGNYEKNAIGCPAQCPSCGKLCEREIHPNDGKCQIMTGHQICSMGGKVWHNDTERTAVLFMCDDYKDDTKVNLSGKSMNWGDFKNRCGSEWNWDLPTDSGYRTLQRNNRDKMKNIWDKFGQAILKYYLDTKGTNIKYIPYTSTDEILKSLVSVNYFICFVIDGTGSMSREIERARISVGQFIKKYKERGSETEFKVVIYRDHCDNKVIEIFPQNEKFTSQHKTIERFLESVEADGGGDYPEAALDGLATAATKCEWENRLGRRNLIIHIYDAPPHGNFPKYESHNSMSDKGNCCCCNHGSKCNFDWRRDVWNPIKKYNIQYNGICTDTDKDQLIENFEDSMKKHLGELCGKFQMVGSEQVNDAILQIFIDI